MTNTEIKASSKAGNSDWEILAMVVTSGIEYPDAVYRVSQALSMDNEQRDAMERDYDECA